MSYLQKPIAVCVVSILLSSCGGSDGDGDASPAESLPNDSVATQPTGSDSPLADAPSGQSSVSAATLPTDDINTGGYVGSTAGLRDTITIPEDAADYPFGVAIRRQLNGISATAQFGSFSSARRFNVYMLDFNRPLDSCHLTSVNEFSAFGEELEPFFSSLGAGEVLPLFGSAGSVGEMQFNSILGYESEDTDDVDAFDLTPTELSINIPGDEFPAFDTVAFPTATNLVGFSAADPTQSFTRGNFNPSEIGSLVWEASSDPDTYLHLEFTADIPGSQAADDDDTDTIEVHCSLEDDGEFTFPQQIMDLYPRLPEETELRMAARVALKEIKQEGASLLLIHAIEGL